jgi:cold shock protein
MAETIYKGSVKWFDVGRGFGFLTAAGLQKDVFVHFSAVNMKGYKKLDDNQPVQFQVINTEKGLQAVEVTPL